MSGDSYVAWAALGLSTVASLGGVIDRVFRRGKQEAQFVSQLTFEALKDKVSEQKLVCLTRAEATMLFASKGETALAISSLEKNLTNQIGSVQNQVTTLTARLDEGISEVIAALHSDRRAHP